MKSVITLESVFAWVRANQILPSVSRAAIREILGETYLSVTEAGPSEGAQILLTNLVPLSQLSSTLII
jgi:hypothetical protein